MNSLCKERQASQLAFDASAENIIVGNSKDLPLPLEELTCLKANSPYVIETFNKGLTAHVYHLCIKGQHYTLKQKRTEALVKNIDGQTSFLNEVQRRRDFHKLKSNPDTQERFKNIVPTIYANYRQGIILSPWLEGTQLKNYNRSVFEQILNTAVACEEMGLMEWDLCPGNIIDDQGHIWLFDFGYMYPFNPLLHFNSNGTSDPLFHACERFETRSFFSLALKEQEDKVLPLFKDLKEVAHKIYSEKLLRFKDKGASLEVQNWLQEILRSWEKGLSTGQELKQLYMNENFRSQVLDIEDDLHGKSCTKTTLKRIDFVKKCISEQYKSLLDHKMLFYGNANKTQEELLALYEQKMQEAIKHQV